MQTQPRNARTAGVGPMMSLLSDVKTGTSAPDTGRTGLCAGSLRPHNDVLAMLWPQLWSRLESQGRRVLLHQNEVLHEEGTRVQHVYFIEHGLVSMVMSASDGTQVEAFVVGSEGAVGVPSIGCSRPALHRAVVQSPGKAFRLPVGVLQDEWRCDLALQEWMLNYTHYVLAQTSQGVLCNRAHNVEERLCRWLLTARDRVRSNHLEITHECIAQMLGVWRAGVSTALGALQQRDWIHCGRGHITITQGEQLQNCACECYTRLTQSLDAYRHFLHRIGSLHH